MRISCFAGSARCKLSGQQGLGHLQRCQLAAALHDRLLQCHSMSFRQLRPALQSGEDRGSSWQLLTQHRCGTGCSQLRPSRLQRYKSAFACGLLQVLVSAATCFLNPTVASAHRHRHEHPYRLHSGWRPGHYSLHDRYADLHHYVYVSQCTL